MKLWLDDLRPTPETFDLRAYTAKEAIFLLATGKVTFISFDHDLGEEADGVGNGYEVAKWIEEQAAYGKLGRIGWAIHSSNGPGRKNIEAAMKSAERFWG